MDIKKGIKKIVALGTGALMLGTTIIGAMAATPDLSNYPSPFIKDGKFDGTIVIGTNAATQDVLGAIDLATSLQYNLKEEKSVSYGTGVLDVEGDATLIGKASDGLEIGEFLSDVQSVLTEDDLAMLETKSFSNSKGSTDYNQYFRFAKNNGYVVYEENEYNEVGAFLKFDSKENAFEYEVEFEEGIESDLDGSEAKDFHGETISLFGQDYTIVDTNFDADSGYAKLTLMAGETTATMKEKDTKTFTIDEKDYEVTVTVISDDDGAVKLEINGEQTDKLYEGETDTLSDGTQVGIREVIPNEGSETNGEDYVEFYIGSTKVELVDTRINDDASSSSVKVENTKITKADVQMTGTITEDEVKITNIKYTLEQAQTSRGDMYIPVDGSMREELKDPESMFAPGWNIEFKGLTDVDTTPIEIVSSGDDAYELRFTTQEGLDYSVPLVDVSDGFRIGDNRDDLIIVDGQEIGIDTMFILNTNDKENDARTRIMSLEDVDEEEQKLTFSDMGGDGEKTVFYDDEGYGELIVGGDSYTVHYEGGNIVTIDQDGNPDTNGENINIVVKGGGIISLNQDGETVEMALTTQGADMDEGGDEVISWVISHDGDVVSMSRPDGIELGNIDDVETGMTRYGSLVEFDTNSDPEELSIEYPEEQRFAQVIVKGPGEAKTTEQSGNIKYTTITERIQVGKSVLDSSITDVNAQNMIVVGGPCVNTVASTLMGNPADCAAGFSEGNALVKLFQNGNKVAMLVAGYSAADTTRAARTLANYEDYKDDLVGTEVSIKGTGLSVTQILAAGLPPEYDVTDVNTTETNETTEE